MQLVGINGLKRSGKGTTASILSEMHDGIVYEVGFADKLKILAAKTLGFTERDPRRLIALMDEAKESWDFEIKRQERSTIGRGAMVWEPVTRLTGRQYLQNLGAEARAVFGDTFWIDQVLPRPSIHPTFDNREVENYMALRDRFPEIDCVAITDLRYENEALRVKGLGGVVWEVLRPGTESDGHATEQPLPRELVDHTLNNRGDIENLRWEVDKAMELTL